MKLKFNMLAMTYHNKRVERLLKWQKLHLMDCATLTKTHPGRLFHMAAPNPSWPPSAQRSFMAAQKIDTYLSCYFTNLMNEDVRIHLRQRREEDNEQGQVRKTLPFWFQMACDLEFEPSLELPPTGEQAVSDDIPNGFSTYPIRPGHRK